MDKHRVPREDEKEILRRNGIDPEGCVVELRTKDTIRLLRHKTRDTITVHQGDKKWEQYC